jgi:hypothetical protein
MSKFGSIQYWHLACHLVFPSALMHENISMVSSEVVKVSCIHTGKAPEDFAAWPWSVNEKTETDFGEHQAQQLGYEK